MDRVFFVGPGRMGLSLGEALQQAGAVSALTFCGRSQEPPSHPLFHSEGARYVWGLEPPPPGTTAVCLSVPDDALEEVAHALAGRGDAPPGCAAFHLSGSVSADPLAPLHARGYSVGTLHPLQSVANPHGGAERLFGSGYALSGEPEALAVGRRLVAALGGRIIRVPASRRPLYHAAAVFASNYLVVILDAAVRSMMEAGVEGPEARDVLLSLAQGTLDNLKALEPEHALTGPVSRGDLETVGLHLRSLPVRERELYARLGAAALEIVGAEMPPEIRERMAEMFEDTE